MADINTPNLEPTKPLNNFRFWCQKVLPLVYDDALSYYEVLGKMVQYLNDVIDDVNADTSNVNTLYQAFLELQAYVEQAIQYDIHDLEEAVATAVHSAEMASESATLASGSATSASESAGSALESAQQASGSASNAANSALNALEAQEQASGYASNANQSAISSADSALNAIAMAGQASGYATRAEDAKDLAESAAETASQAVDDAEHFKDEANTDALKAEGLAVGKQNGVDVDSSSEYYHNNAKYYAEQAGQASGLSVALTSLTDVDIQNPSNGQTIVYDEENEKWVNSDEAQAVTSLEELTDTDINNPSRGQVVMYDGTDWVNSEEKEIAIAQTAPSDPATKMWIDETQQTPIEIPTSAELNAAVANINTQIGAINTTLGNKANSADVANALNTKENKSTVVTEDAPSAITLVDNYEYYLTNVSALTFTYPSGNFECWIYLETATSGTITLAFPSSEYIGKIPTFGANEKWEISIKNSVIIAGKIE